METAIETRSYVGVTTADIVKEMLTENTGGYLTDSGGIYGRNWSRNQGKDFDAEPEVSVRWSVWRPPSTPGAGEAFMEATVSLYHWLANNFEFDAELQTELDQFAEENSDMNWLELSEAFASLLHAEGRCGEEPNVVNTYNDPDNVDLSQTIQYTKLYMGDEYYEPTHLIINVHGGCDVRGGYASPKVLKVEGWEYSETLERASVSTICAGDWYWYYRWGRLQDHHEKAPDNDILKLPCYDPDWVAATSEDPRLQDLKPTIHAIEAQRQVITSGGTNLSPTQVADALGQLDAAEKRYDEEYREAVEEILAETHSVCTYVLDNQLYLVIADQHGMPEVHKVTAHNE